MWPGGSPAATPTARSPALVQGKAGGPVMLAIPPFRPGILGIRRAAQAGVAMQFAPLAVRPQQRPPRALDDLPALRAPGPLYSTRPQMAPRQTDRECPQPMKRGEM
jgi:hypothetical protein